MPDWEPGIVAADLIDPSDVLDYEFDFTEFLDGDSASTITVVAVGANIDSSNVVGSKITVWLSAAVSGVVEVTFTCVSVAGRTIERSIKIIVDEL